jgi:hypothetical protein
MAENIRGEKRRADERIEEEVRGERRREEAS